MNMEIFRNSEFGSIRVIEEDGKYLFCGSDVAKALGYSNPRKAVRDHARGGTKRSIPTASGDQTMTFLPEGDVYRLIVHSRLPGAERFEKWVFDEVLPTIRRTGGYMTPSLLEEAARHPEILLSFADQLLAEHEKNRRLTGEVERLRPKADFYDAFVRPGNCTNIRATAKELGVGERNFCRFLMEEGFLYRCPAGYLLPYAKPSNKGLFQVKDFWKYGHFRQQTLITPQGKDLLRMMLCGGQMSMEFDFFASEAWILKTRYTLLTGRPLSTTQTMRVPSIGFPPQLAFLAGRIKDEEDVFHVLDAAKRYGEIAEEKFQGWGIPGRYLVFGDPKDLKDLMAKELAEATPVPVEEPKSKKYKDEYIIPGYGFRMLVGDIHHLIVLYYSLARRLSEAETEKDFLRLKKKAGGYEKVLKKLFRSLGLPEDSNAAQDVLEESIIRRHNLVRLEDVEEPQDEGDLEGDEVWSD